MPPLLSSRTCWITGWVALLLGLAASFVPLSTLYGNDQGYGPVGAIGSIRITLALSQVGSLVTQLGLLLLVAAVIVRHVERLRDGPGRGGPENQEPGAEPPPRDHVDLDEGGGTDLDLDPGRR